jgi:signal transduction histidine kinase
VSRRLLGSYLLLALIVLVALEVPLGITHARAARRDLAARVERDAATLATFAQGSSGRDADARAALRRAVRRYAREAGARVVIVDPRGRSVLDTGGPAGRSFASRPEVRGAIAGLVAGDVHPSRALGGRLTVAVPVAAGGRVDGAVRVSVPTGRLDRGILRYWLMLAGIAGVVLAATAAVGHRLARSVAAPLGALERATAAGGAGDLSARAPVDRGPPEVRAAARGFNGMVARLGDLVRAQAGFVADASHQLRSPLTALRLRLENLERDVAPAGRADLDGALAEVERLSRLVDGLLALARADAGAPAPRDVDVRAALSDRARAWAALAEGQGVRLEVAPGPPLTASATPDALAQVLDNLLANALDVSPAGAALVLRAEPEPPTWVALHVLDEGPGMTSEARARAFDRFWRGRRSDGFGLGLAIVSRLVAADGGRVELRARRRGLDAVVHLKAVPPLAADQGRTV